MQQVKDQALSLQWIESDRWPGNFHMLQEWPKKKKKKIQKTNNKTKKRTSSVEQVHCKSLYDASANIP